MEIKRPRDTRDTRLKQNLHSVQVKGDMMVAGEEKEHLLVGEESDADLNEVSLDEQL